MLMKFVILFFVIFSVQNINGQTILNDSLINLKMYKAVQFLSGSGGSKNIKTAFELYLECAKAGKPQAMIMAGLMYRNGTGVDSNKGRAVFWFTKAGNAGYANGWYLLGDLYKNALRKQQNYKKAFSIFPKGRHSTMNGVNLIRRICYTKVLAVRRIMNRPQFYLQKVPGLAKLLACIFMAFA